MSSRRFAVIDPAAGVSGDMLLGALIDLGLPAAWLRELPARLGIADAIVEIDPVDRSSIRAIKVTVKVGGAIEGPGDVSETQFRQEAGASGGHSHSHPEGEHHHHHDHGHGPHRHVAELLAMIERAELTPSVKARARAAFELLAAAEARIHGTTPDRVALHEVGAHDALIDIVGVVEGFERLGVEAIYTRPVALGRGWIRAAHGLLPVPAPATTILLEGLPIAPEGPVEGEATTPTGAALLRVLTSGRPSGEWTPIGSGWGAGGRDPKGYPNAVKVMLGERAEAAPDVVVVATDLDDMSPEYLEPLREALTAAGALDVQSWATQMKKGRIGFRVEAIAPPARLDAVADAFFRHSTTAGVRWWTLARRTLAREGWTVDDEGRSVRVKTLHAPGGDRVKPEYDDVVAAARESGEPAHELYRRYHDEALRRVRATPQSDQEFDHAHQKE
ncbi:MAG: nickel pincer cofactor biosynthesis protein LarC [Gemmatimonadales bacterium]